MKRILYISYTSPLAPYSGFAYRALGVLGRLSSRFQVDLVFQGSLQDLSQSFIPLDHFNRVEVVSSASSLSGIVSKIKGILGPLPYHHVLFSSKEFASRIGALLRQNEYDLIWLNKSVHFPVLESIGGLPPIVIDQIAAEPCAWDNLVENDPRWYVRWFSRWNKLKVLRFDKKAYARVAGVICISQHDEEVTKRYYPGTRTVVIPQGFNPDYYCPSNTDAVDLDTLIFSGTGATRNVQAIKMLLQHIMPFVHKANKCIRLLWIGNVERERYPFLDYSWVETTGFVEHVPPYFARGMIFVAPFDMGEGMKTKIVEAMAMGKVIVSTPTGTQGIDVEDLPFIKVRADHEDFANAILEFRNDPDILELGKMARRYAIEHYSWDIVLSPLWAFIEESIRS